MAPSPRKATRAVAASVLRGVFFVGVVLRIMRALGLVASLPVAPADARSVPLDAAPTLARVDAVAARLAASDTTRPAFPAGLSAREVEVLRFLAAGKTNREIAETLFLSIATINNHVAHILAKTNAENRVAAAVYAQRHGLI